MSNRGVVALVLEALGVVGVAVGAALWSLALGCVVLGIGLVAFGVALERD